MINHIKQENHEYKKIRFQILPQAPTHETNRTLVKTTRILMDMPIRHIKQSNKGLNKLIHDPIFHTNTDVYRTFFQKRTPTTDNNQKN